MSLDISATLPLGISYLAFQNLGYVIDVYRNPRLAIGKFPRYFAGFAFFPALTSGPILNTVKIAGQFENSPALTDFEFRYYLLRIANGLFKKTVADLISGVTASYLAGSFPHSTLATWTAVLGFTAQYYADFSGYTDIAVGAAGLLGFKIPENFRLPFLATSFADFWRRWHISLYEWLKYYFYFPATLFLRSRFPRFYKLAGGRVLVTTTTLATLILVGLWHRLSWNYFLWGSLNGALILLSPRMARHRAVLVNIAITFTLTCLARVLAATPDLSTAVNIWRGLFFSPTPSPYVYNECLRLLFVITTICVPHFIDFLVLEKRWLVDRKIIWWISVLALLFFASAVGIPNLPFKYAGF